MLIVFAHQLLSVNTFQRDQRAGRPCRNARSRPVRQGFSFWQGWTFLP